MKREVGIILGNALIWGVVMIACSMALKGTGHYQDIQNILAGGAGGSLIVVGMIAVKRKPKE